MKSAFKWIVDFVIGYNYTGYGNLKIGKDGVVGVKEGIMDSCFFTKYMDDIIGSLISFCFGFID